ncbi:MAG: hypothetical protein M1829_003299 [Trizodia sp. TS-e1964]|nr:MAG: hypothetical protein M1829_003299 [Trizodia sp. TS-e1964]
MNEAACRFKIDFVLLASLSDIIHDAEIPSSYNNEIRELNGIVDYSISYNNGNLQESNLVVIEAKRDDAISIGTKKLAAYMGIIHKRRKDANKMNAVVYGILTSHSFWAFYRIDNNGNLNRSRQFESPFDINHIYSYITIITKAALEATPTTSPIKDAAMKLERLESFRDDNLASKFDYRNRKVADGLESLSLDG